MNAPEPAILFCKGAASPPGEPRTLIVVGAARGGTTMVAQMLHDLGVFMGQDLGSTCQDGALSEISRALFDGRIAVDHPGIEQLLRERDRRFAVWGWKFPARLFAPLYARARNPHVIAVFRDPVAIATRESLAHGHNIAASMAWALEQIAALGRFVRDTPHPCLAVSYERGLARKHELADALAAFAAIEVPVARRRQAAAQAQPATPRYVAETRAATVEGQVDRVDRRIEGWLRYPHEPDRRVAFTVLVDGARLCDGVADRFRDDLRHAFANDGCCAFAVPLPPALCDGRAHNLRIVVPGEEDCAIAHNGLDWTITASR